ncbi:cytochrome c-type biogenesis protein CcmE [Abditibacterium utsteinense]|uniref:Cytochrome c-type biogenesis protein CcmE n=1 Tax=Abditibacterium utsteinense TaxID=1960156 RepID=A0A2S8SXR4_9BACT|nr:cytochrome c maturation protein CcmE [Abditibacterium utsteinense]PQV65548.1 cytochrome c-type biogenesis protein CcmE [Abditibacterium utsteinense]
MQSRYLVGSLAILGALGFLVTSSLQGGTLQAVPVAKLRAADGKQKNFVGKRLRMVGFVGAGKVTQTPQQTAQGVVTAHKFAVIEGKQSVMVSYTDALPDTFRAGGPVQVDGVYTAPGQMKADHVLTKCPSKYQAEEAAKLHKEQQAEGKMKSAKVENTSVTS